MDDRPFSSIIEFAESSHAHHQHQQRTLGWVGCGQVTSDSESCSDDLNLATDYQFKSFNHYFDEPIYSEPDPAPSQGLELATPSQGRYHCRQHDSEDSDYESFNVDTAGTEHGESGFTDLRN